MGCGGVNGHILTIISQLQCIIYEINGGRRLHGKERSRNVEASSSVFLDIQVP